jgi:hypothetical protein
MSLGFHEQRRRRQKLRRAWLQILWWSLVAGVAVGIGYVAYDSGTALARRDVTRLEQQLARVEAENTGLKDDIEAALALDKTIKEHYGRKAPPGAAKKLVNLVRDRLAAGVAPERLAFVIQAAQDEERCDEDTSTRRFIAQTQLGEGANDTVSFANNRIVVTASGTAAIDTAGNPEAWFNPAQPITVRFAVAGGAASETAGVLPLHPSVVTGDSEYRFNLVAGARGFINVTGQRCDYP